MEIVYFSPGDLLEPGPPLAPYRPLVPAGALEPYLEAYTQPGDLVIDLFCQGPRLIHEAIEAGRRALGLNINRALLLAASLGLTAGEREAVEAAFTRLATTSKGPETLQAHIQGLYRTSCTHCGRSIIADAFVWDRDESAPVLKLYRCATCDNARLETAPTDQADRETAARFSLQGLSYWLMAERTAPAQALYRERLITLLDLYTPRNLAALSDLLLKSEGLELAPPVRQTLDGLLLEVLDRATGLRSPDAPTARPNRLRRPARYLEANVWRLFEDALETWLAMTPTSAPRASSLKALLAPSEAGALAAVYLSPLPIRQVVRELPPACASLILVDPPRPNPTLWHLSALWSSWLWGHPAGAALEPFVRRRQVDWDWFWRGVSGALRAVAPLLRPEGRLVGLYSEDDPALLEALNLAAASAGYELLGWGGRPPGDMRLTWRFNPPAISIPVEADPLSRAVAERAADAALSGLRARGEPVAWPTLHAAVYADLAESGLLAQVAALPGDVPEPLAWLVEAVRAALDGAPLRQLIHQPAQQTTAQPLWWLDEPLEAETSAPLADRVELTVAEILRDLLAVAEVDLSRQVCARFPGPQTPDAHLVRLCLFSYGEEHAPGHWRLRTEDVFEARVAETDAVIGDLAALGRRLGFQAILGAPRAGEWAVRWVDEAGYTPYAFAVRTTAVLGDLLFDRPALPPALRGGETQPAFPQTGDQARTTVPCLTLPGGRAVLVGYKLRHDPRLRRAAERRGWQFLKFRHLRHLVKEVAAKQLDRYAFQAALGLDPIVEQTEVQMSLW